jgi:hypothetical protein
LNSSPKVNISLPILVAEDAPGVLNLTSLQVFIAPNVSTSPVTDKVILAPCLMVLLGEVDGL